MANGTEITTEQLAELTQKHGKVLRLSKTIDGETYEAVFRRPSEEDWDRFITEMFDDETKALALKGLVIRSSVFPERAEFRKMIAACPGLSQAFGNNLTSFAGMGRAEEKKD